MRAGTLRHRVTFQVQTETQDTEGQRLDDWTTVATVWAEVADVGAREIVRAGVTTAEATTVIRCRHRSDITTGMRALHRDRTLEIVGPPIDREGRDRELEILCREIQPDG